jgi:uncharacterized LabA/DUF88 family protein
MKNKEKIYAFIDSQNLNLGLRNNIIKKRKIIHKGWKLDFAKFRVYLKDKYNVEKAFIFIGYLPGNESLYTRLQEYGYILVIKPTLNINGRIKGNVDAELVLHTMIEWDNFDKAIIVSGDGDFLCLEQHLFHKNKLHRIVAPTPWGCSSLIKKAEENFKINFLFDLKNKLSKKDRFALRTIPFG